MKCANHDCKHGIGLVSYRRGWFDKRRFCSKKCRDESDFKLSDLVQPRRPPESYFEWLFAQPAADTRLTMASARARASN